jgi:hypothetical protein
LKTFRARGLPSFSARLAHAPPEPRKAMCLNAPDLHGESAASGFT